MRRILVTFFSGLMLVCTLSAIAGTDPVGIVDYEKVGQALVYRELLKVKMNSALGTARQKIETLTKAIQEKKAQLADKNTQLSDDQKSALLSAVEQQKKNISDLQSAAEKKVVEIRMSFTNYLKRNLEETTKRVAAKHNLSIVFSSSSVAYTVNKVDITDEVITELAKILGVQPVPLSHKAADSSSL